jgi:Cytochrome oxidase complex assembly protein 1
MNPHPPEQKGWFGRNWKWFIPTGCLSIILVVAIGVGAVVYVAFSAIKSSEIYQESLTKVKSNAAVVQELGEPIEAGWQISGNINVSGDSGKADVKIPVSGPKKSGSVYATAIKKQGKWDFSTLEVEIEGKTERINLLTPSSQ